ncbi:MAG: RES domain-containing protein [Gammaproteobacteria bacterium]|nr:RES domain-containing protein [Gammaproteobacteria bacterium]
MSLTVYRCGKAKYRKSLFSGVGGLYVSGRWTPRGHPVVYASEHASLAILDYLANYRRLEWLPDTVIAAAEVPDEVSIASVDPTNLPKDWNKPTPPETLMGIGKRWLEQGQTAVLEVPSVLAPGESNYLLNPRHPDYTLIRLGKPQDYLPDNRLL